MADRIVVMNDARIQQVADPLTIATKPATELVARFMGDNNIIRGKVTRARRRPPRDRGRARRAGERPRRGGAGAGGRATTSLVSVRAAAVEIAEAGARRRERQLGRLRDRLRRVPRRPRQAAPHRRRRADAGEGARRAVSGPPGPGGRDDPDLLEGGGCPAPRRLSPERPHLDLDDIEEPDELEQSSAEHERALGEQRGAQRERGRSWVTLAWARPGLPLARLLPDRSARLHRADELLDAGLGTGFVTRLDDRELQRRCSIPSAWTTPTGRTC